MDLKQMRVRIAGRMKGHERSLCIMIWDKGSGQYLGQYLLHQKDNTGAVDEPTPRRSSLWFITPPDYNVRSNAKQQARIEPMILIGTSNDSMKEARETLMEALERDAEGRFIEWDVSKLMKKAA